MWIKTWTNTYIQVAAIKALDIEECPDRHFCLRAFLGDAAFAGIFVGSKKACEEKRQIVEEFLAANSVLVDLTKQVSKKQPQRKPSDN